MVAPLALVAAMMEAMGVPASVMAANVERVMLGMEECGGEVAAVAEGSAKEVTANMASGMVVAAWVVLQAVRLVAAEVGEVAKVQVN